MIASLGLFIEVTSARGLAESIGLSTRIWILSSSLLILQFVFDVLPLIFLFAATLTTVNMIQRNEFLAFEALGQKRHHVANALIGFSLALGYGFFILIFNPVMLEANKFHETIFDTSSEPKLYFYVGDQIWIRFKIGNRSAFVRADRYNFDEKSFENVSIFLETLSSNGTADEETDSVQPEVETGRGLHNNQAIEICYADKIAITDVSWRFEGLHYCEFDDEFQDITVTPFTQAKIPVILANISAEEIEGLTAPTDTNVWNYFNIQRRLDHLGFSFRDHNIHFNILLTLPLLVALMAAIGTCFLPYFDQQNIYWGAFWIVIFGLSVYFLNNLINSLGKSRDLTPPLIALLFPLPVAMTIFTVIGIKVLPRIQTRKLFLSKIMKPLSLLAVAYGMNCLVCYQLNLELGNNFWVAWIFPLSSLGVILLIPYIERQWSEERLLA